jgi:hypothetical protein
MMELDQICPKCGRSVLYRKTVAGTRIPTDRPALEPGQGDGEEIVVFSDGIIGKRQLRYEEPAYKLHGCGGELGRQAEYR